jgi:hypothetical protein
MQRVTWDNIGHHLERVWYFVDIVLYFMMEYGMYGPMIHAVYTPLDGCKMYDKITLGYMNISAQNRRLIAHSICKAVDNAYIHVFKKKWKDAADCYTYRRTRYWSASSRCTSMCSCDLDVMKVHILSNLGHVYSEGDAAPEGCPHPCRAPQQK